MKASKHTLNFRFWRLAVFALGIAYFLVLPPTGNLWKAPLAQSQQNDDAFDEEFEKARGLLKRKKFDEALKSFKRANELRDKKAVECYLGMAQAYQGLEAYKNVVESCDKVIELSGSDTKLAAVACNMKGIALQNQAEGKDQKKLLAAEAAFRQGLNFDPQLSILHYNLGVVLMQQGRDSEGTPELNQYVKLEPDASHTEEARKLIENPRRARENYAPDFAITTAAGEYIASEDLHGKVVLLDFWGTWCPPCVASVPALRSLNKRFAKEPTFVMIGISTDGDADTWRSFTAENKMVWPQYLDRDRKMVRAFSVKAFPTYILIDHEGIVRFRSVGTSWERSDNLEDAIRKYVKLVGKSGPSD